MWNGLRVDFVFTPSQQQQQWQSQSQKKGTCLQPKKLIFGMQPYLNPTSWNINYLNYQQILFLWGFQEYTVLFIPEMIIFMQILHDFLSKISNFVQYVWGRSKNLNLVPDSAWATMFLKLTLMRNTNKTYTYQFLF